MACYNPHISGTEFQQARPVFKLPVDSDPNSATFGDMLSEGFRFNGGATCPTQNEWGGDVWVIGIEMTSQLVLYQGAWYPPLGTRSGFELAQGKGARMLIEDCSVHDMGSFGNFTGDENANSPIAGVTVRRNVAMRTWTRELPKDDFGVVIPNAPATLHQRASRSGGMYIGTARWSLVEDNFFSQNGWSHESNPLVAARMGINPLSPKSVFSQAMYFPASSERMLIQNNVVSEPAHCAIQSRGNFQRIFDNLVLEAPMGISLGHAENQPPCNPPTNPNCPNLIDPTKYWRGEAFKNVILNSGNLDTWTDDANGVFNGISLGNSPRGRGVTISRCRRFSTGTVPWVYEEEGQSFEAASVHSNLIAHNDDGTETNGAGIYSDEDRKDTTTTPAFIATYSARVYDNVVYNWLGGVNKTLCVNIENSKWQNDGLAAPLGTDFVFQDNKFVQNAKVRVARARWNPTGGTWLNNKYFTANPAFTKRYLVKPIGSSILTQPVDASFIANPGVTSWKQATTDTSISELSSVPPSFMDPSRNLLSYMNIVSLPTNGAVSQNDVAREFMKLCALQRRGNWNPALTAGVANNYIRAGFGL